MEKSKETTKGQPVNTQDQAFKPRSSEKNSDNKDPKDAMRPGQPKGFDEDRGRGNDQGEDRKEQKK